MTEATISLRTHGDMYTDGHPVPVQIQMEWFVEDPAVVNFWFTGKDNEVVWGLDRQMLTQSLTTDGLLGATGGDVKMGGPLMSSYFTLILKGVECTAYMRIPREDVECAVAMSRGEIEIGSELEHTILAANVNDAIERILNGQ